MINEDVNWLLGVWHILLLTLEVNLHCYRLADSFRVLEKNCTSQEHPTPALSGEEAAEPWSICTPLRLWLCLWCQNTCIWDNRAHPEIDKGLGGSLNHHQAVLACTLRALLKVTVGLSACPESSWPQHSAPKPEHMQVMWLYTPPKAHCLPFMYPVWFCP